jgi:hypothetical protein
MHRPKRLDGARARPETWPRPPSLLALLTPIFPAQFAQFVGMFAGYFDADEMLHPVGEMSGRLQKKTVRPSV